jgi:hypothetical protein
MQSRCHSAAEAVLNIAIGYLTGLVGQFVFFPWCGIHMSLSDNVSLGMFFTLLSLARIYACRRF